jgi:hypothetical protein
MIPGDARIPVRFGPLAAAGSDDGLLIEDDGAARTGAVARFSLSHLPLGHAAGCACCMPRGPVAAALTWLFQARARGQVPWFRQVLAVVANPAGADAVRAAVNEDVFAAGRFRLE